MIKQFIRQWLGIHDQPPLATAYTSTAPTTKTNYENELKRLDAITIVALNNYANTLNNITLLQQKFDVLVLALGVEIVGGQEPRMSSIRANGLLENAQHYIEAGLTAEKILALQYRCLKQQAELFADLKKSTGAK